MLVPSQKDTCIVQKDFCKTLVWFERSTPPSFRPCIFSDTSMNYEIILAQASLRNSIRSSYWTCVRKKKNYYKMKVAICMLNSIQVQAILIFACLPEQSPFPFTRNHNWKAESNKYPSLRTFHFLPKQCGLEVDVKVAFASHTLLRFKSFFAVQWCRFNFKEN